MDWHVSLQLYFQSIEDSQVDFAQAYVKMRDHVMLADKDSVMGGLDRYIWKLSYRCYIYVMLSSIVNY